MNSIPIITLELEGMRSTLKTMLSEHAAQLDQELQRAVDSYCSEGNLARVIDESARRELDAAIKSEVASFFSHSSAGRAAVREVILEYLNERFPEERRDAGSPHKDAGGVEHIAEVMPGWALAWAGSEPIATLLARHPGVGIGSRLYAQLPPPPRSAALAELTDDEIEAGRRATFSTDNPYCPCDSKAMRKAVRWAERAIAAKAQKGGE